MLGKVTRLQRHLEKYEQEKRILSGGLSKNTFFIVVIEILKEMLEEVRTIRHYHEMGR